MGITDLKKWVVCSVLLPLLMSAILVPPSVAGAADNKTQTIRIAYPLQAGLTEIDENGTYTGYTYEYLQEIAQYTNWNYEFVQLPGDINESLTTLMDMLAKGEIDFMGGMLYQEALAEQYDYAGKTYGSVYTVLQTLEKSSTDPIGTQVQQTLRVAVLPNALTRQKELLQYCEQNMITPELIFCNTTEEQITALKEGRADAMINTSMNPIEEVQTIARFAAKPFYFMTTKGRTDLVQEINDAIQCIEQADPFYSDALNEKYFNPPVTGIYLSDSEKTYAAQSAPITVGVLLDAPPFQYLKESDNTLSGIGPDLLRYISDATGLQFTYITAGSAEELLRMAMNHEVDLISNFSYDYEAARSQNIALTRPYLSCQNIMVLNNRVKEDDLSGKRLALPKGASYYNAYNSELKTYNTLEDCIAAVSRGDADYTYVNGYSIQFFVHHSQLKNLRLIPMPLENYQVCFGITKPVEKELLRIINKCIIGISPNDLQAVIYRNTTYPHTFSLGVYIRENPFPFIAVSTGLLLCTFLLLACFLCSRAKTNKQTALELKKHLQVYELTNDCFFEYNYSTRQLFLSIPAKTGWDSLCHDNDFLIYDYNRGIPGETEEMRAFRMNFLHMITARRDGIHEIYGSCPDGKKRWLRIATKTVYDHNCDAAYTLGKINDIDNEKREKSKLKNKAEPNSLTHIYNTDT